jgi:ABC-2 type transport system permease protein
MRERRTASVFPERWPGGTPGPDAAARLPPLAGEPACGPVAMSPRQVLRAYLAQIDFEIMRHLRQPDFLLPALLLPSLLYGGFLAAGGVPRDPAGALFWLANYASLAAILPGLYLFAMSAASDQSGAFALLQRVLPIPPSAPLIAKLVLAGLVAGLGATCLMLVTWVMGGILPPAGNAASLVGTAALCSLPFSGLGLIIGTLVSGKTAIAAVHGLLVPLVVLSGLVVPPDLLPDAMQSVAEFSPGHDVLMATLGTVRPDLAAPAFHLIYLLLFAVILGVMAQWRSRQSH